MDVDKMKGLRRIADALEADRRFQEDYLNARVKTSTLDGARRHVIREAAKRLGFPHQYNLESNYLNAYFNHIFEFDAPVPFVQENGDPNEFVFYPPFFVHQDQRTGATGPYGADKIRGKSADAFYFDEVTDFKTTSTTKEEPIMAIQIKTITYVNGTDASTLSDDQVFALIGQTEKEIKALEAIENKPKKLEKKIQDMRDSIGNLIMLVDDSKKDAGSN